MNDEAGAEVLIEGRLPDWPEPVLPQANSSAVVRVIVPAHHETEATVALCLSALQRSKVPDRMEIVLADDSEHEAWALAHEAGVGWCRTRGCAQASAAAARNAGAKGFQGKVLVFVDADVKVEPEAIQALIEPSERGLHPQGCC